MFLLMQFAVSSRKNKKHACRWHSLPELNRAFAVGETAFLTARRREHDSRNKTACFPQAATACIALPRKESMIFTVFFLLFNQTRNSNRRLSAASKRNRTCSGVFFPKTWRQAYPNQTISFLMFSNHPFFNRCPPIRIR
ncbi:hypothetical protein [Akkermansia sp. UBA3271]|uniref:hypothetical protein n=1 Tax=Akkermansia sp. UBA3271 TaxID=1945963 RepID=UPI0025C6BB61|nr:hypothetical protein [Akkermansia sp. UBA3271]